MKLFGLIRQGSLENLLKLVNESIGNIKEIILSNSQNIFKDKFNHYASNYAEAGKKKDFYFIIVRPILEILIVLMFLILVSILIRYDNNYSDIFIVLGVFSFASIKLIALVGNLVREGQTLRYNSVVVDVMYNELYTDELYKKSNIQIENNPSKNSLKFDKLELLMNKAITALINRSKPLAASNLKNDLKGADR